MSVFDRRWSSLVELAAILALLALGVWQLRVVVLGDSANSRLATAYALVYHGTWYIDNPTGETPNPFSELTVDKAEVGGRIQSTKPPLLPLLMTAQYAGFHHLAGWTLDDRDQARTIVRFMIVTLMLLPLVAGLLAFRALLQRLEVSPPIRALLVVALALGTPALGFAGHINNHTPAMALLCVAFWAVLPAFLGDKVDGWRIALYGLAGGMVFAIDLPLTVYVALAGLPVLYRQPRQAVTWGALGLVLPVGLQIGALYQSTGSILPIQMHPDWYLYRNAYWRIPGGVDALNEPKAAYLFHMTFGRYGTFSLFPVFLLGLLGSAVALRAPGERISQISLISLAAFAILTTYYVFKTNNYGGAAYGFRWHLGSAPVLLLMAVPFLNRLRRPLWAVPLLALLLISGYSAWECYQNPWSKDQEWTARQLFSASALAE
ncbi:MAG: hypothetical protein RLZZ303_2354 [Candidatus Hydrogenedentota bacterium]|jgi:hypothetical protein